MPQREGARGDTFAAPPCTMPHVNPESTAQQQPLAFFFLEERAFFDFFFEEVADVAAWAAAPEVTAATGDSSATGCIAGAMVASTGAGAVAPTVMLLTSSWLSAWPCASLAKISGEML